MKTKHKRVVQQAKRAIWSTFLGAVQAQLADTAPDTIEAAALHMVAAELAGKVKSLAHEHPSGNHGAT